MGTRSKELFTGTAAVIDGPADPAIGCAILSISSDHCWGALAEVALTEAVRQAN